MVGVERDRRQVDGGEPATRRPWRCWRRCGLIRGDLLQLCCVEDAVLVGIAALEESLLALRYLCLAELAILVLVEGHQQREQFTGCRAGNRDFESSFVATG